MLQKFINSHFMPGHDKLIHLHLVHRIMLHRPTTATSHHHHRINTINKIIATSTDYKGSIIIKKKKKSQRTSAISVKKKKYYLVNRKETKCQVNIYVINCNQIKEKHLYIRLLVAVLEFTHSYVSMSCQRCTNFACNNICDKLLQFYRTSLIKPTTHHSLARC